MTHPEKVTLAIIDVDGRAICEACAPFVGSKAPYIRNWNAATELEIDTMSPLLSSCPRCERKYHTPVAVVLASLIKRIERLEGAR